MRRKAMQYRRISADCHLDLPWLPPELFVSQARRELKDRMPYGDVEAAAKEVYRVAKLGLKGLELSCSWDMEPMWHPMWEPLWKAVNDVQLPLHFHTFPSVPQKVRLQQQGQVRRMAQFTSVA